MAVWSRHCCCPDTLNETLVRLVLPHVVRRKRLRCVVSDRGMGVPIGNQHKEVSGYFTQGGLYLGGLREPMDRGISRASFWGVTRVSEL